MHSLHNNTQSQSIIPRMAWILMGVFRISEQDYWVWKLGHGEELTQQEAIENWIRTYINQPDPLMADALFPMLYQRFEEIYFNQEKNHVLSHEGY